MSRKPVKIIAHIEDAFGVLWDVRRIAPAPDGTPCHHGWPHGWRRGRGGVGGPAWVLTPGLIAWLERNRFAALAALDGMPFGRTALKRMRRQLGHHGKTDRRAWWVERLDDLASLESQEFTERHTRTNGRLSAAAVDLARAELVGFRGQRKAAWRDHAEVILGGMPTQIIADKLGIAVDVACKMRWLLEDERGLPHHRQIGRYDQ